MIGNTQAPVGPRRPGWFRRHRKLVIIVSIVLVLLLGGGAGAFIYFNQPTPTAETPRTETPEPEPEPVKYYSPLSGALVADEATTKRPVTGMMIENSPNARPQSGLKNSGVIYEAIAEGGITRFLVLYQEHQPQMIGPVRSLRLYDLDWLRPYDGSIGHVGGSARALQEVRNGSYRDLDQFFNSGSYWRATDRYAPHNVYTSFERLDALNTAKGYQTSSVKPLERSDSAAAEAPVTNSVNVTISSALYNSAYVYNKSTNSYDRYQGGAPHLDREDGQISPRVVVVMKVNEVSVLEDGWRQQITTTGNGPAYIFQDGFVFEVTWHKDSQAGQIYFTNAEGARVPLARGQTWFTAIPQDTGSVSWQ
jgi:hypothetical protein